jgi:hypothetical protein
MKKTIIVSMLALLSFNSFSSTLVKCVVPSPRNVLILDIDQTHLKGKLSEMGAPEVSIESTDGYTFVGADFNAAITLAPGVYTSPASKTHAVLTLPSGERKVLNCIKRNFSEALAEIVSPVAAVADMSQCRVVVQRTNNPHRDYDNKFRACRTKAFELKLPLEEARACTAICMKN